MGHWRLVILLAQAVHTNMWTLGSSVVCGAGIQIQDLSTAVPAGEVRSDD